MYQYAFYPFGLMVAIVIYILVCCHYRDKYELVWGDDDTEVSRAKKKRWDLRAHKAFKWFLASVGLLVVTIIVEQLNRS